MAKLHDKQQGGPANRLVPLSETVNTMDINFDKSTQLSTLQHDFQKRFNYLKIEFFKEKKEKDPIYTASDVLDTSLKIEDASSGIHKEPIHITGLMKVRDVEQDFSSKLGLYVQIFRKSGKVWLITSSTDQLTLDEMNKEAREKETPPSEIKDDSDYHDQE